MAPATQNRGAPRHGRLRWTRQCPVAAATKIYQGTIVARNAAGYAIPATATAGLVVLGVALDEYDNTAGDAGDVIAEIGVGTFAFENDTTDALAIVFGKAYVVDDQTVGDGGVNGDVLAGVVEGIDGSSVFVDLEPAVLGADLGIESVETVTTGALNPLVPVTLLSVTDTVAFTLADGVRVGQRKTIVCTVAGGTPDGTLTPATAIGLTTIGFDAVGEIAELVWTGAAWAATVRGATPA